jgi:hypothetical protein
VTWYGSNPDDERRSVSGYTAAQQRAYMQFQFGGWDQATYKRAAGISRKAPWLRPGLIMALTKGGANDDTVGRVATQAALIRAQQNPTNKGVLDDVHGYELDPGNRRKRARDLHRASQFNVAKNYVTGQMRRGAEAKRTKELKDLGILDNEGVLNSPVELDELEDYRRDPGAYATRRPKQANRIHRFLQLTASMAGGEGRAGSPYGGPLPPTHWQEVPFRTPSGVGAFRPPVGAGRGGFFTPEQGVEPRGLIGTAGSMLLSAGFESPQVQALRKGVGLFQEGREAAGYAPGADVARGAPGEAVGAIGEGLGAAAEPLGNIRIPQATIPGTGEGREQLQAAGPTGATSLADVAQYGFAALDAPYQELQGQVRNAFGAATGRDVPWWSPQSDFAIMLMGKDPGGGFFVNNESEVAEERRRREAERGKIYGQRVTFGRIIAAGAVEAGVINPNDKNYRVLSGLADAAVALYLDPTIIAAGKLAKVQEGRSVFAAEHLDDLDPHLTHILGVPDAATRIEKATALRLTDVSSLKAWQVKSLARTLRIEGRNTMKAAELRAAVKERLPRAVMGENIRATGVLRGMVTPQKGGRTFDLLERAGALRGSFSNGIHGMTATAFFQGTQGSNLVKKIAEEDDAGRLYFLFNGKLNYKELQPFKNATTAAEVEEAMRPLLGKRIRSTGDLWRAPAYQPHWKVSRDVKSWLIREAGDMPTPHVEMTDDNRMLPTLVEFLRNVKTPDEDQFRLIDKMVAGAGDDLATLDTWEDAVQTALKQVNGPLAEKWDLGKRFMNDYRRTRNWLTRDATEPRMFDEAVVDGKSFSVGNTNSFAQLAHAILPLPDPREMRRLVAGPGGRWAKILSNPALKKTETGLGWLQDEIWKPLTLLRFAWAMRVIPEEQLRMAARGHASLFKDPAGMISFLVGHKKTITGDLFDDLEEFKKVVHQSAGWMLGDRPGLVQAGALQNYAKGNTNDYLNAVADEFRTLSIDDVAPVIARAKNFDEGGARFIDGDLADVLAKKGNPKWADPNGREEAVGNAIQHIRNFTKEDDELLDVIRTGKFRGKDIFDPEKGQITKEFKAALRDEKFPMLPDVVTGPHPVLAYKEERNTGFVNFMFRQLMGRETAYLSRSPEFRQSYWDRVVELVEHGDAKAKDSILAQVEREFGKTDRHVVRQVKATEAKGDLALSDIDELAKAYAIDDVKTLLYDLQKRSQAADQIRLISPFAEAWKEVVTRWTDLMLNPMKLGRSVKNLHRFDQIVNAARGTDFGEVMGAPRVWDPEKERFVQQGFFAEDEFGEEVFLYPGSQFVTHQLTKILPGPEMKIPLTGRVAGLNMIGQVFPGLGPIAQIPVTHFLADKPGWQRTLRGALLPFGSIADAEGATSWLDALNYAPPWMRSGIQALTAGGYSSASNRIWANAEMAAANYLYSTGNYDTHSQGGVTKLLEDARQAAPALYMVKALVSFGAPTAPRLDWMVKTENQGLVRLAMLRDDYYRMVAEDPKTADDIFLERWGDSAGLTMQAFTREITGGIGVSKEWGDWSKSSEAKHLKGLYPATWAFHGPQGGEFNYDTYLQQILGGKREQLDVDEYMALGQLHLGSMLMEQAREKVAGLVAAGDGVESDYAEWLHDWEDFVYENYPGYTNSGTPAGTEARVDREDVMRELARAVKDPRYTKTKFGGLVKDYWDKRMSSITYAHDELGLNAFGPDYSLQGKKSLIGEREWLNQWGTYYADQDENFKAIWNRFLRSEVEPTEQEAAEAEAA